MPASLSRHGTRQKNQVIQYLRFKLQSLKTERIGCTSDPITNKPMTLRSDGRRVISATMHPDLYNRLYAHCRELDIPVTVFMRNVIKAALPPAGDAEPAP